MNTKFLIKDIYDNYKMRRQDDVMNPIMGFIEEKILPFYRATPYRTSNEFMQLIKIRFVELIYQVLIPMPYIAPESMITMAVACFDLGLVETEFCPKFHIPELGKKSAEFARYNFGGFLSDKFGIHNWNEDTSFLPSMEEATDIVYKRDKYAFRGNSLFGSYIYDINNLAPVCSLSLISNIRNYLLDFLRVENDGKLDLAMVEDDELVKMGNKTLIYLKNRYGNAGTYKILSPELQTCYTIYSQFDKFKTELIAFEKENKEQLDDPGFWGVLID